MRSSKKKVFKAGSVNSIIGFTRGECYDILSGLIMTEPSLASFRDFYITQKSCKFPSFIQ